MPKLNMVPGSSFRNARWGRRALGLACFFGACLALSSPCACDGDNDGPQTSQCLGTLTANPTLIAVGTASSLALDYANPDDDTGGALTAVWTTSGGGHFDQQTSTLSLLPFIDQFGFPGGTSGSTTNNFNADGPPGTYTVHVTLPPGAACQAAAFDATIQVVTALPDAGPQPDASPETDGATQSDAAEEGGGATDASDAASDAGSPSADASGDSGADTAAGDATSD